MADTLEKLTRAKCEQHHTQTEDIPDYWRPARAPKIESFEKKPHKKAHRRKRVHWSADNVLDTLPRSLSQIATIIDQSRTILDIVSCEDNGQYDCNEQTWIRATEFLTKNAKWIWDHHGKVIDIPDILPGPDNSIDLHWEYQGYELLINIPADPKEDIGYYGDDYGVTLLKGKIKPNKINLVLLQWLAENK